MTDQEPYWTVELSRRALRDLRRLDPPIRARVLDAIQGLKFDPPVGDITRMVGVTPPEWRLRVGDWRIRFKRDVDAHTIQVLRVLPRGRAYRD